MIFPELDRPKGLAYNDFVGEITCADRFTVREFSVFFFSNEGQEPPHVHVEAGENYAKFWLAPLALARSVGFNSAELSRLGRLVEDHRELFKEQWDEYFGG